jgi:hypothetical protein
MDKVTSGELTAVKAMKMLGMKKTTFYNRKKLYMEEMGV